LKSSGPFPFHLCQPDEKKSCGACCGLYNWQDHLRPTLTRFLRRRTSLLASFGEDPDLNLHEKMKDDHPGNPKFLETIYNCEFLGFIDLGERRIGCLLHPSLHQGNDQRNHCVYGAELCAGHFCPSYSHLARVEQAAVIAGIDDWYLYGLVITDIDLVKEFFQHVQTRLGDHLRPERLERPEVKRALGEFFQLKEFWKFSSRENRLGKYYFSYGEYQIARIDYEKRWAIQPSRFDKILVSLSSEFACPEEIREAESIIEEKIRAFTQAYQKKT
jgi:hypothetical protein